MHENIGLRDCLLTNMIHQDDRGWAVDSWKSVGQARHGRWFDFLVQLRFFPPRVNFQCRFLCVSASPPSPPPTPAPHPTHTHTHTHTPCRIACIYICAHVTDPKVHIRVRWIMETLKHPACTVGWVARLCRSWLSPGKATRISHGRNPNGTMQSLQKKEKKKGSHTKQQAYFALTSFNFCVHGRSSMGWVSEDMKDRLMNIGQQEYRTLHHSYSATLQTFRATKH